MTHAQRYFALVGTIAAAIDSEAVERMARGLARLRERGGRLFLIGVGGSAANCSHAVNDFRKLAGIEAHTPTDNVAELTARINDEGWETCFSAWLGAMRAGPRDLLLVLSVGGGDAERRVSVNLVHAIDEARLRGLTVYGIVGRDGGYTKQVGDEVLVVPTADPELVTPLSESFQAVVWHGLVSHPSVRLLQARWEGLGAGGGEAVVMVPAVFLDRDGVINGVVLRGGRPFPPDSVSGLRILPGVADAVRSLRSAGYRVIVVTNQPDVGSGAQTAGAVEAIHGLIGRSVPVDEFRACYHTDRDGCSCRKPKPGMLLEAASDWGIDLTRSYMVGDRWRDVGAGRAAGCATILIGSGYGEGPWVEPDAVAGSLAEASAMILSRGRFEPREGGIPWPSLTT